MLHDSVHYPSHYTVYPVQPIQITRYLGFCFGNAVKYVLRAPYKGGVEDCDKARQYLLWERDSHQRELTPYEYDRVSAACEKLIKFFSNSSGDQLWDDIAIVQSAFIERVRDYSFEGYGSCLEDMYSDAGELSRILSLRDKIGEIYEGMTGLPQKPERERNELENN